MPKLYYGKNKGKREKTPNLLKDPKFTKKGVTYMLKKKKTYAYDLSSPYIKNPHLYSNP